jgi:hypothetical protein
MKRPVVYCLFASLIAVLSLPTANPDKRAIAKEALLDKIKGGWAAQMFGVVYGAPTEFRARGATYDAERVGTPAELKGALNQDDLYVEMTLAEVMDRYGLDATAQEYGEAFRDSKYALWHANLAGRRNLSRGIMPPQSGHPRYNAHANDIDFQIEADFIGLMAPGLPRAVQLYGDRIGHLMNYGDGVYGGIFIGAMYAAAFFENDTRKVVEAGLEAIPAQSGYAAVIRDLLAWHREEPRDWRAAWKRLEDKWDRDDPCPDGALTPFNIDAKLNGAFVALGLLYGEKDFEKTIEIAARAGQDSDCNPASAGGILGVMLGYKALPSRWVEALVPIAGEKFNYTTFSYDSIVASTLSRAAALVARYGGKVTADGFEIPVQKPSAMKLEQWNPGRPAESVLVTDARWQWKGEWKREEQKSVSAASETAGGEAEISFEGTGAMVVGAYRDDGGYLEVYLDGKKVADTDGFVAGGNRAHESLWHADNLRPGKHTLRLVVTGKRYPRSKGAWIYLHRLVVFSR